MIRRTRLEANLTQTELATRLGIAQPNLSAIETGRRKPRADLVARVLSETGFELDAVRLGEEARPRYLYPTLAETAAELAECPSGPTPDGRSRYLLVSLFLEGYQRCERAGRPGLIAAEPGPTGHAGWDAFMGGLAEHVAYHDGLQCPRWVNGPGRFSPCFFFPLDTPSVRAAALSESPPAFARRSVFIAAGALGRA